MTPGGTPGATATSHVAVRAFRQDLATMLRRAAAGEQLVVTVDGRPLATVGPLGGNAPSLDALVAAGQLVAPRRRDRQRFDPQPVWAGVRLDQAFTEVRGR